MTRLAPLRRDTVAGVGDGVILGLAYAVGFSAIAAVSLTIGTIIRSMPVGLAIRTWLAAIVFYLVAGAAGGAVYGALRPVQDRYYGRFLTAYLILWLVYGGATVAFWPVIGRDSGRVTLPGMLAVWGVLAAVLAPIYLRVTRRA